MTNILLTGVNRGIGLALAKAAIDKGWTTFGSVRNLEQAVDTAALLDSDLFRPLVFDVTSGTEVASAAQAFTGPLDILINNAGIMGPSNENQSAESMDFSGFAKVLEVNTLAPLRVSQEFLPALRKAPMGRILTVSSQMAWMGYADSRAVAYRASKSAVNKVMQCLATDLTPENMPVALIDPGWVKTDMGGEAADLNASDVATGIIETADTLDITKTGKFFKWSGEERPF